MDFREQCSKKRKLVDKALTQYLEPQRPEILYKAMSYSVDAGGKRLRPLLLLGVCEMLGGNIETALPFACAVELIHTSSLIHDDLPALDDDDLRRGIPANHKRFGDGIALLAGDALLNLAYEIMADVCSHSVSAENCSAMREIAVCSGSKGIIGGQIADLQNENKATDLETLYFTCENKTAKLIRASAAAGAILTDASESVLSKIREASTMLGIAFQIKDDILDYTSSAEILGKNIKSDEKNNKPTFATVCGIQKAKEDYTKLSEKVYNAFSEFDKSKLFILPLIDSIREREF